MKLERFDLYCGMGHSGDYRKECEDGEYVEYDEAIREIDALKARNAELLKVLRQIADRGMPVQKEEHRIARTAIAKAKGETE